MRKKNLAFILFQVALVVVCCVFRGCEASEVACDSLLGEFHSPYITE